MAKKIILASLFFLIGLFCLSAEPALAKLKTIAPRISRIFYYRDSEEARKSFFKNYKSIDVLAPQAYSLDENGTLAGGVDKSILEFAQKHNVKVMPLVTNKTFSQGSLEAILKDQSKQDSAISMLVDEGKNEKFWGWQIDFEQMDVSYRDLYSAFIKKFGEELKKNNLVSSVSVIAHTSENPADYPKNLWQRIIGVYDYTSLSASTDFISVMAYDDPESKGPVARYSWIKKVIENSLSLAPKEKISLGIPLYYWLWDTSSEKLIDIGGYKSLKKVMDKYKVLASYSKQEQAPYITYTKDKKKYKIWYENKQSIEKKIELIKLNKLNGFSAWALGLEHPSIYKAINTL